nr:MAG TPA: hypothetical protein [Caudoviricetes sp.]
MRHSNVTYPEYRRSYRFIIIEYYTKSIYFISLVSSIISSYIWISIIGYIWIILLFFSRLYYFRHFIIASIYISSIISNSRYIHTTGLIQSKLILFTT